ncbi:BTAD domain-containing putative transcriptional regulator [Streptomyces phaeochromogenes]|uniref:AfsR/SARP family transcriptional regulator n=1 Tax=Streptomyces phaeochromogenes TaxID=1923 RepID=UPI003F4D1ABE
MGAHHPQAIAALVSVATAEGEAARLTRDSRRLGGARSLLAAAEQRAAVHQRSTPPPHERDAAPTPPGVQFPPPAAGTPRRPEQRGAREGSAWLRLGVLGPVRAWRGSEPLPVGSPQQRALLAALVLREGRIATVAELIDSMWGEDPPSQALAAVRTYASRLRKILGSDVLVSGSGGYALQTAPDEIDLCLARELAADAERSREMGEDRRASELLDRALALWDGEPLAGVPGPFAERHRAQLTEWRLHLLEIRLELDLDLGSHAEVVSELTALTAAHPLRERLRELLMLALYRSGRKSEAIAVYDDTQRLLADAVGVEPGPGLRQLQERILHTDPALAAPHERPVTPQTDLRPYQLPSTVSDFTGRAAFMSELDTVLTDEPGAVAAISALAGIGGVGKTTLAVHAAHRARRSFPDGQLYVDLRGVGPDAALPEAVLGAFLRSLGTPESALPDALDDRAALYRSLLDGRRVLVLLDNARDAEQVRPLLPGAPGCATLITSRVRMVDLAGAHLVDLDVMSPEEALQFFTRIVGEERVTPEREAALDVVTACGFLPLAIRIAGSRLAARRTWTVSVLAAKLSDERRRLDELQAGDLAVRATFAMGYRQLVPGQARAFRLLGLANGPDISLAAAAAMLDQPVQDAEKLLETLVDAGFLESAGPGRYRYHDLVRLYARSCATEDEQAPDERESALARLLDFYLATAAEAYAVEHPGDRSVEHLAATRYHDAEFSYLDDARRWLNTEASCVLSCVRQLAHGTLLRPAIDLLWSAKDLAGSVHHRLYQATAATAKEAAHEARDAQAMGRACAALTAVHLTAGNLREADEEAQRALALAMAVDDPVTIAWAPYDRGVIAIQESRHAEADLRLREALARFRADDNLFGVASALCQLSHVETSLGNARSAVALAEEAIDRLGDETDTLALAECRYALGLALVGTGQILGALEQLDQALVIFQDGGQALGEGTVHFRRAEILLAARRHAEAAVEAEQALAVFHRVGGDRRRADVLVVLGDVLDGGGESARARSCWTEALAVAERVPGPEGAELRGRLETRLHGRAPSHTSW